MFLTLAVPITLISLIAAYAKNRYINNITPYLFFFIGPILTYFGFINVLTGFDVIDSNNLYFGITFYTVFIAYHLSNNRNEIKKTPLNFIISVLNPLYLFTGPIPNKIIKHFRITTPKTIIKRLIFVHTDLLLGILFAFMLAPVFKQFFYLKESTTIIDIILFGIAFELYVYFNFAGFSFIAVGLMRLLGIKVLQNFNQPFSATSIVEYWQRWHISLSFILKKLFFEKIKSQAGLYTTVFIVFLSSAIWHGISYNFIIWGLFHSIMWIIAHYFHKKKFKVLNYFVLINGIVIGRIIFSEIDLYFLFTKLRNILNIYNWNSTSILTIPIFGITEKLNFTIAILLILLEVFLPRFGYNENKYTYLKSPFISCLIALYICLMLSNISGGPIYGNR